VGGADVATDFCLGLARQGNLDREITTCVGVDAGPAAISAVPHLARGAQLTKADILLEQVPGKNVVERVLAKISGFGKTRTGGADSRRGGPRRGARGV